MLDWIAGIGHRFSRWLALLWWRSIRDEVVRELKAEVIAPEREREARLQRLRSDQAIAEELETITGDVIEDLMGANVWLSTPKESRRGLRVKLDPQEMRDKIGGLRVPSHFPLCFARYRMAFLAAMHGDFQDVMTPLTCLHLAAQWHDMGLKAEILAITEGESAKAEIAGLENRMARTEKAVHEGHGEQFRDGPASPGTVSIIEKALDRTIGRVIADAERRKPAAEDDGA